MRKQTGTGDIQLEHGALYRTEIKISRSGHHNPEHDNKMTTRNSNHDKG